jgi:hypothetical protein
MKIVKRYSDDSSVRWPNFSAHLMNQYPVRIDHSRLIVIVKKDTWLRFITRHLWRQFFCGCS